MRIGRGRGAMMEYENLRFEYDGPVAIITVNRPKVLNALDEKTIEELERAVEQIERDDGIRAAIFTGAGEKAFVAGADIAELRAVPTAHEAAEKSSRAHSLFSRIENLPKPVIMAINGFALGGGCELAMAGDIRIAAETAKLGQPEINLGLIPGYGGTQRLPRLVGKGMAKMLILTGDMIDAQEARRIGLVDKVVPADTLMEEARALARKLAEKAPLALRYAKRCIDEGLEVGFSHGCRLEAEAFGIILTTEDEYEGTSAFLEKRKPEFKGR